MKKNLSVGMLICFMALLSFTGCKKTLPVDQSAKTMDNLQVAGSFDWQTTMDIKLSIGASLEGMSGGLLARISVFNDLPASGGNLLATGSAGYEYPFSIILRVPDSMKDIYLMVQTSTGYQHVVSVPVATEIFYTFTGESGLKLGPDDITDPDCDSGCTNYASGSGTISVNQGKVFCVTSSFTGNVNFQPWNGGGTLKVCGSATPSNISNFGNNCTIIVTDGGTFNFGSTISMDGNCTIEAYSGTHVQINGINMNNSNSVMTNYSDDFTISQSLGSGGTLSNYGEISIGSNYTIWSNGTLENSGILTIGGQFEANNDITNSGSIESTQNISFNSGCVVVNNCKLISHNNINLNSTNFTMNNGYMKADQQTNISGGVTFTLQNQSMVSTYNYQQNANITGQGSMNSIIIGNQGAINSNRTVSGPIEMSTPNGILTNGNSSLFINGASLVSTANATNFIPTSDCNPEGTGSAPVTDTDGDGVPNNLDDYPLDATRAYNTWYPNSSVFGSIGFEDLWPATGDYDMNDLVVDYQYKVVSNAQNNIVDIIPKFYVRAVGASFENGFGFQLDNVVPAQVETVTGFSLEADYISLNANGTETNQSKAVVIVFDNADNVINRPATGSFYNTMPNVPTGISDTVYINLHFATPIAAVTLGTPPYNIFLIKNMTRDIEVHMPDYIPTSLANPAYFDTDDDTSDPATGRYYKSVTNLPWAINTPIKFDYTYEEIPIIEGYNHFGTWAESSGVSYPDWYTNQSGFRTVANIYE